MRQFWINRTACCVLDEIRTVIKVSSAGNSTKAMLYSLVEELQVMFNRMESALADKRDLKEIEELRHKAKAKLKELELKVKFLGGDTDEKK